MQLQGDMQGAKCFFLQGCQLGRAKFGSTPFKL